MTDSWCVQDLPNMMSFQKQGLHPVPISDAWDMAESIGAEFVETSSRNNVGKTGV